MLRVRVVERIKEAEGIVGFLLERADGESLPEFVAGAHIDVHLGDSLSRQYSICSSSNDRQRYRIGVLREPLSRGGSKAMHEAVQLGDVLMVSEPKNHFPLAADGQKSLLFAGGIGITPLLCMAGELERRGSAFEFHYCGRSRSRMAFLDQLGKAPFAPHVHVHFDDGDETQRLDAVQAIGQPAPSSHLYVCGPAGFMTHILDTGRSLGWTEDRLHREYFAPPQEQPAADRPFEIELRLSGRVIAVAADCSAAGALATAGVHIPQSCRQGVCGTCITRVMGGVPDHRDAYFTDEERRGNDIFTPCCSRALTDRLVLDL